MYSYESHVENMVEATQYCNAIMTKREMKIFHKCKISMLPYKIGGDEWVGELCDIEERINIISLATFVRYTLDLFPLTNEISNGRLVHEEDYGNST